MIGIVHSALRLYYSCDNQVQPTQQVKSSLSYRLEPTQS